MRGLITVQAIAKELIDRGHYLDELYQVTITYAASLWTRYHTSDAKRTAIEKQYEAKYPPPYDGEVPYVLDDNWNDLDDDCLAIEDEMQDLFNTVIGFEYDCNPFKN